MTRINWEDTSLADHLLAFGRSGEPWGRCRLLPTTAQAVNKWLNLAQPEDLAMRLAAAKALRKGRLQQKRTAIIRERQMFKNPVRFRDDPRAKMPDRSQPRMPMRDETWVPYESTNAD